MKTLLDRPTVQSPTKEEKFYVTYRVWFVGRQEHQEEPESDTIDLTLENNGHPFLVRIQDWFNRNYKESWIKDMTIVEPDKRWGKEVEADEF